MNLVHQGFIGYPKTNVTVEFVGSDREELFNQNLKTQPEDWYYRNKKIEYTYNSLGHRCKDIKDLNLSNYILFAGCSHTEGIGLELQHTYPYRLAERLNCDYYNLALGGTGIDIMTHNLTMWSKKIANRPKAVVILWPDSTRFMTIDYADNVIQHLISDNNPKSANLIIAGDDVGFFESRKKLSKILISHLYDDCPIINACSSGYPDSNLPILQHLDYARDLGHQGSGHFGILSHDHLAVELSRLIR